jgi:hypothetical protein
MSLCNLEGLHSLSPLSKPPPPPLLLQKMQMVLSVDFGSLQTNEFGPLISRGFNLKCVVAHRGMVNKRWNLVKDGTCSF